jgi:hypothetical protein
MAEATRHPGLRKSYLDIAEAYDRLAALGQAPANPPADNTRDKNRRRTGRPALLRDDPKSLARPRFELVGRRAKRPL